jgi:RNA polymerase sigma-70 factor (ECF subfamily)
MDVTDPAPDERILRDAVLRGDEAAWRILCDRYFDAIFAYVHWKGRLPPERAEEIVQESWMIAVRAIRKYDPARSTFGTWLRGIANNVLRNEMRKTGREAFIAWDEAEGAEPAAKTPEHEPAESVAAVLRSLPDDYRAVLTAKYCDGLAVTEIAAVSGRTPKAVESLLTRARDAFRREWSKPRSNP